MRLEMFGQMLNLMGQYGNLHLRRTRVAFVDAVLFDNFLFDCGIHITPPKFDWPMSGKALASRISQAG
jgi:hypothetical protein